MLMLIEEGREEEESDIYSSLHRHSVCIADNATRVCLSNGTWANRSDYSSCVPLDFKEQDPNVNTSEDTTTIFFTGYTISIVALTLAIWIFIHFK